MATVFVAVDTGEPDYFTEQFSGSDNDLDNFSILWMPDQSVSHYRVCGMSITDLPTSPTGGTKLALG